jgi:hypothetical protein
VRCRKVHEVAGDRLVRVRCMAQHVRMEAHSAAWLVGAHESLALDWQWSVTEEEDKGAR